MRNRAENLARVTDRIVDWHPLVRESVPLDRSACVSTIRRKGFRRSFVRLCNIEEAGKYFPELEQPLLFEGLEPQS
ncbi:MAG: hypothetical protein V2A79_17915 [Planctomycetota bacterium]